MTSLITLPLRLSLQITGRALALGSDIVRLLLDGDGRGDDPETRWAPSPHEPAPAAFVREPAPTTFAPEPAPTASARQAAAAPLPLRRDDPLADVVEAPDYDEPTAQDLTPGHVDSNSTLAYESGPAADVGAAVHVEAPWEGYDRMKAAEIVKRLRSANDSTRAVVRLYERQGKARSTVLGAAG